MSEQTRGLELLEQIRPFAPKLRFLQSWDRDKSVLRYGCGDEKNAVCVGSDRSVEKADTAERVSKLKTSTVKDFVTGSTAASPFDVISTTLRDYVYLQDERLYNLFSAWIVGTYVYSMFSHFGYLFLFSDQPRCGKTRAEEVISHLAFEATEPRNAPTPPSMRETAAAGGTVIFDTLERWKEKSTESYAAAMDLLDAGFRNGGVVVKMVPAGGGEWKQEQFPVYAPYMLAAIRRDSLTDTALDRSFAIEMFRKNTRLRKKPYDTRCETLCEPIRQQLYLFALSNAHHIGEVYESKSLQDRVDALGLTDRAVDIWKPLLAVIAVAAKNVTSDLETLAVEMSPDVDRQEEMRQLRIISGLRTLAGPDGVLAATTQQIIQQLKTVTALDVPDLHDVLSQWRFPEKSIRLSGVDTPRRAWELKDADLAVVEAMLKEGAIPS